MKSVKPKIRVVLDTNIIISALIFGGIPRQVTDLIVDKAFRPVSSEELMTELRRVISERFPRARHDLEIYEKLIHKYAIVVPLGNQTVVVSRDPDDDKFIETAIVGNCQYIVSGDKDLLDIKTFNNINIVSAIEFLRIIRP